MTNILMSFLNCRENGIFNKRKSFIHSQLSTSFFSLASDTVTKKRKATKWNFPDIWTAKAEESNGTFRNGDNSTWQFSHLNMIYHWCTCTRIFIKWFFLSFCNTLSSCKCSHDSTTHEWKSGFFVSTKCKQKPVCIEKERNGNKMVNCEKITCEKINCCVQERHKKKTNKENTFACENNFSTENRIISMELFASLWKKKTEKKILCFFVCSCCRSRLWRDANCIYFSEIEFCILRIFDQIENV